MALLLSLFSLLRLRGLLYRLLLLLPSPLLFVVVTERHFCHAPAESFEAPIVTCAAPPDVSPLPARLGNLTLPLRLLLIRRLLLAGSVQQRDTKLRQSGRQNLHNRGFAVVRRIWMHVDREKSPSSLPLLLPLSRLQKRFFLPAKTKGNLTCF